MKNICSNRSVKIQTRLTKVFQIIIFSRQRNVIRINLGSSWISRFWTISALKFDYMIKSGVTLKLNLLDKINLRKFGIIESQEIHTSKIIFFKGSLEILKIASFKIRGLKLSGSKTLQT